MICIMLDEAFMPFQQLLERMLSFGGEIVDEETGIRFYVHECAVESPVELDVVRDEQGRLQIGSIPPLYSVDTSIRPVFHHLRFSARLSEEIDGD
jgi:hypothetical protein